MYLHNSLIPRVTFLLLALGGKQEATSGQNLTKCISELKVNQLKLKYTHVKIDSYPLKSYSEGKKLNWMSGYGIQVQQECLGI